MSPCPDWTAISDDPNDPRAKRLVRAWLGRIRRVITDTDLTGHVERLVKGMSVLDIGVVSHSARYFDQPGWRHGRIVRAAARCVGLDVLPALVQELRGRGFDVRCIDATSDFDLGERFDVVFVGDVIEHVDNAVALLRFARRHLRPGGSVYVATPNPFSRKFYRQFMHEGVVVVNLDHVAWITPTMALELGRRSGLELASYQLVKPMSALSLLWRKLVAWRLQPVEFSFPDYLYEFVCPDDRGSG